MPSTTNEIQALPENKNEQTQKELNNHLFHAVLSPDPATRISELMRDGADINAKNTFGETPLHWAVCDGNTAIATLLIEKGANINAKNTFGDTPLHKAAYYRRPAIATLLIEKGANINTKNTVGNTPLHRAVDKGYTEIATLLIEKDADESDPPEWPHP